MLHLSHVYCSRTIILFPLQIVLYPFVHPADNPLGAGVEGTYPDTNSNTKLSLKLFTKELMLFNLRDPYKISLDH